AAHPPALALIAGLTEGSPYLWELVRAEPERLVALLESDPDQRLEALVGEATRGIVQGLGQADALRFLRRMRSDGAPLPALAEIGGVWRVSGVAGALTALADGAASGAVHYLLSNAARRGQYQPTDPTRPEVGSGCVVIAMGKMGSSELNYSSDI